MSRSVRERRIAVYTVDARNAGLADDSPDQQPSVYLAPMQPRWAPVGRKRIWLACGAFFGKHAPPKNEKDAVALIDELGGQVAYDYEFVTTFPLKLKRNAEPSAPLWLRRFVGEHYFRTACYLDLGCSDITDDGLRGIADLTKLHILWLNTTDLTDDGHTHLSQLAELRELYLSDTKVTDSSLTHAPFGTHGSGGSP